MNEFERIRRTIPKPKRADLIVEEIKRWIAAKRLRPGDRLPREGELMTILQSSRGTVREALKVLESQGLIEIARGTDGGARVSSVSYETTSQALRSYLYFQPLTWAEVYRVRHKLEPMLAAAVVDDLTADDLRALKDTVEICRLGIAGAVGPREHRIAELEFHAVLARACKDPLSRFLCSFITDLLRDMTFSDPRAIIEPCETRFAVEAIRFHCDLIAAYEQRDRERVYRLMSDHIHAAGCIVSEREAGFDRALLMAPADPFNPPGRMPGT